jgi:hypothetical protein
MSELFQLDRQSGGFQTNSEKIQRNPRIMIRLPGSLPSGGVEMSPARSLKKSDSTVRRVS